MKKENLKKLLVLIGEIVNDKRYAWFEKELSKLVKVDANESSTDSESRIEQRVKQIQDYLNINFDDLIDYDDFDEPSREQLTRDCIEMCRYKKGTPSHKIDYGEFCRYATLQIEEMFNYHLYKISKGDINQAIEYIRLYYSRYTPDQISLPRTIHEIPLGIKLTAFTRACNIRGKTSNILWFLKEFRNELSHRDSSTQKNDDAIIEAYCQNGFSLKDKILSKDDPKYHIQTKGNYIIRKRNMDFGIIYETLSEIKTKIIELNRVQ